MADHLNQENLYSQIVRSCGFHPDHYTVETNNAGQLELVIRAQPDSKVVIAD